MGKKLLNEAATVLNVRAYVILLLVFVIIIVWVYNLCLRNDDIFII